MRISRLWFALLTTACGPAPASADDDTGGTTEADPGSTSSTSSTSTPTTGADETSSTGEPCLALEYPADDGSPSSWRLGCDAPALCPGEGVLVFRIEGDLSAPTSVETEALERARCMVTALADRSFGQFDFIRVEDVFVHDMLSLEIVGDAAVARSEPGGCADPDPSTCHSHEQLHLLREPAFFADCIEGDALAVYTCLTDPLAPDPACLPGPLDCPS